MNSMSFRVINVRLLLIAILLIHAFFLTIILRPPISTPFPTRRSSDLEARDIMPAYIEHLLSYVDVKTLKPFTVVANAGNGRSEEHTSELQSQSNLVCRLLLEKKNKNKKNLY